MIVVLKRFGMDDVPFTFLPDGTTLEQAEKIYMGVAMTYDHNPRRCRSTPTDRRIAQADIGTNLAAFLLVEFDDKGKPTRSVVVPVED